MSSPFRTILGSSGSGSPASSSSEGSATGNHARENILARFRQSSLSDPSPFNPLQAQVDGLVTHFVDEAANPSTLAAMMAGGLAYRFGRIGILAVGADLTGNSAALLRGLSVVGGLGAEVSTFELANRSFQSLAGDRSNPNLWSLRGQGGILQGLASSTITFGLLKGAGHLGREQNLVFQHAFQSATMVFGHRAGARLGLTPRPEGTLAEQLLHAEITNLQLGAGMSLVHSLAPRAAAFERGLDLSLQSADVGARVFAPSNWIKLRAGGSPPLREGLYPFSPQAHAMAGNRGNGNFENTGHPRPGGKAEAHIAMMEGNGDGINGGGGDSRGEEGSGRGSGKRPPSSYPERIRERLPLVSTTLLNESEARLRREWDHWKDSASLDSEVISRIENFLPFYNRMALAHFGREAPVHLPFVKEIFDTASGEFRTARKGTLAKADRSVMIRFLSEQPGRRGGEGEGSKATSATSPARHSLEDTRRLLGETFVLWENLLNTRRADISPSEWSRIHQRGLALMHFYSAHLYSRHEGRLPRPFRDMPLDRELLDQTLKETSAHPYPPQTVELFTRFFRETLGQSEITSVPPPAPRISSLDHQSLDPLEIPDPPFIFPESQEDWAAYLTRQHVTRDGLSAADLSVSGATIFSWGSKEESPGRLAPPGDILHLLGVVTYLNETGERHFDPFDALRLTLPAQLASMTPDAQGRIVISYPALMKDLDYAHFRLGALLRSHIRSSGAHDVDLARQWEVSDSTVFEYRRGVVRKMRIDTLDRLADSLSSSPDQRREMMNLLMFLRYRPYFDASMAVTDGDGTPLNGRPAVASRFQIVLVPHEESLKPLDTSRRVRFEREPFASVLNGMVDLSLDLLETRRAEFELAGAEHLPIGDEKVSLNDYSERLNRARSRHADFFQLLSRQSRSPGVVRPGQIREIGDFYREFFRFFERIHLHTRPTGEISLGDRPLHFEIVPPTPEQPKGVRFQDDVSSPGRRQAYVVAADLIENGRGFSPRMLRDLLHLRIIKAELASQNLFLAGERHREINRALLLKALKSFPRHTENPEIRWADLIDVSERFDQRGENWSAPFLQPSEQAVLHRIIRGRLHQAGVERRLELWKEDLRNFLIRRHSASLAPVLEEVLEAYLQRVPHPFQGLQTEALAEALAPIQAREGEGGAAVLRDSLLQFMASLGLPGEAASPATAPLSREGFSQSVFATYLNRFREIHSLRGQGALILDENLLDRVLNDRLVEAPHLSPSRDLIAGEVGELMAEYNRRNPPLRVYEIPSDPAAEKDPFPVPPLEALYESALARSSRPMRVSERWIYASLRELDPLLRSGEEISSSRMRQALETTLPRLEGVLSPLEKTLEPHLEALSQLTALVQSRRQALARLSRMIPDFVTKARFQSGLEDSRSMAEDLKALFSDYLEQALIRPTPLALRQVILERIRDRFGPYTSIREDVVRGLAAVTHEFMKQLRKEAPQLEEGLELSLSYAQEHHSVEKFWEDFVAWARDENPSLKDRETLTQYLQDLDETLPLFTRGPTPSLRLRLQEILQEIEALSQENPSGPEDPAASQPESAKDESELASPVKAVDQRSDAPEPAAAGPGSPPIDAASLLASPVDPERMERFPELVWVKSPALLAQATEARHHLANPEGRAVLQLIALLKRFENGFSPTIQEQVDHLILEAETSNDPIAEITRQAFEDYSLIRKELLVQIPLFDRLGLLSEIRKGQAPLSGPEAGRRAQHLLSLRRLPAELQKRWLSEVESRVFLVHEGKGEEYLDRVARFYEENREAILKVPEFYPQDLETRPLDLDSPPPHLRERLERETPELDLFGKEQIIPLLEEDREYRNGAFSDFWSLGGNYLNLKLRLLFSEPFRNLEPDSPLLKVGQEFLQHYRRINALALAGSSLPHLAVRATEQLMEFYRRHQGPILNHLIATQGVSRLMETLPELRTTDHSFSEGNPLSIPGPLSQRTSDAANRMIQRAASARVRRGLEPLFWNFTPPTEQTKPEELEPLLRAQSDTISRHYLENRREFQGPRVEMELPSGERSKETLEERFSELIMYWEPDAEKRQKGLGLALEESLKRQPLFIFRYEKPGQMIQEQLLSLEEISQVHQNFMQNEVVRFSDDPDYAVHPTDKTVSILITPFYQMRLYLAMKLPQDLFRMTEFISPVLQPVLHQEFQRDMDRAASLLMIGVDERWVMAALRERLVRGYEKYRDSILQRLDFISSVSELGEVKTLNEEEARDQATAIGYSSLGKLIPREPANELLFKIVTLCNWERVPPRLGEDLERTLNRVPEKTTLSLTAAAARFYFEHRRRILPHLPKRLTP